MFYVFVLIGSAFASYEIIDPQNASNIRNRTDCLWHYKHPNVTWTEIYCFIERINTWTPEDKKYIIDIHDLVGPFPPVCHPWGMTCNITGPKQFNTSIENVHCQMDRYLWMTNYTCSLLHYTKEKRCNDRPDCYFVWFKCPSNVMYPTILGWIVLSMVFGLLLALIIVFSVRIVNKNRHKGTLDVHSNGQKHVKLEEEVESEPEPEEPQENEFHDIPLVPLSARENHDENE